MIPANYFHDGYRQAGYVAAEPRVHGALRFSYRPATVEERSQLGEFAKLLKAHLYDRQAAAFMAEKLGVWDLTDTAGNEVPIAVDSLLRLQPTLFVKLHRIAAGWAASDVDPQWTCETAETELACELEAALTQRSPGDVRAEHDEKN